jgi:tol-pal system protein YbgF
MIRPRFTRFSNKVLCSLNIAGTVVIAVLVQCAPTTSQYEKETLLPEIDVIEVKENSDEAIQLAKDAKLDVEMLNTRITDIDNKLFTLSEEMEMISIAKIEELENRAALLTEAVKELQIAVQDIDSVLRSISVSSRKTKKGARPTFAVSDAGGILGSKSENVQYQRARQAFNSRNYSKAIMLYKNILKEFPKGTYTPHCHYWIGESYYATGDFANAIASFNTVFDYPRNPKLDDAQLKIGLSYLKIGKYTRAKEALEKLIRNYPSSEYVGRAKKYIAEMK